jgi:hypothetical protein
VSAENREPSAGARRASSGSRLCGDGSNINARNKDRVLARHNLEIHSVPAEESLGPNWARHPAGVLPDLVTEQRLLGASRL